MKKNTDYLVVDLEATCDRGNFSRDLMETIEIGAVYVDGRTLQPVEEFQTFIRPVLTQSLTPFCTELTSITQADVDGAPRFGEAIALLWEFLGDREYQFASWGAYDWHQLRKDALHHQIRLPLRPGPINLKETFSEALGTRKRFGMKSALRRVGLPLDGTHHRGIDDARNIAKLLPWCLGRAVLDSPRDRERRRHQRRRDQDATMDNFIRLLNR